MHDFCYPTYFDVNKEKLFWGEIIFNKIIKSGMFNISQIDLPKIIDTRRRKFILPFVFKNKLCLFDYWDHPMPTVMFSNDGFISKNEFYRKTDYIIKIQKKRNEVYKSVEDKIGCKVLPFAMFPSKDFPLECFNYLDNLSEKKQNSIFSGVLRRERLRFINRIRADKDIEIINKRISMDEFVGKIKFIRYGLILAGRGDDTKNRREVEYSSCGIPLVMNYKPNYPFEFMPDYHYIYIRSASDLDKIKNFDLTEMSKRSKEIYDKYFTANGYCNLLDQLIQ